MRVYVCVFTPAPTAPPAGSPGSATHQECGVSKWKTGFLAKRDIFFLIVILFPSCNQIQHLSLLGYIFSGGKFTSVQKCERDCAHPGVLVGAPPLRLPLSVPIPDS